MDPHHPKLTIKEKNEENDNNGSSVLAQLNSMGREQNDFNSQTVNKAPENASQNPIDVDSTEREVNQRTGQDDQSSENVQNQLVLYDPAAVGAGAIVPVSDPVESQIPPFSRSSRALPSIGAFAAQCAKCFKWRFIPTIQKYEQIREHLLEQHFYCETAREWRPEVSCDDPPDLSQDGSRLWAIDRPNIAQPPPGWQRHVRIRAEGGTKFADVYYEAPSGKRFRSMVEVEKYLQEHPEYMEQGVRMSQFSFQVPRPLQENYVRKRPARSAPPHDGSGSGLPGSLEPTDVNPISWFGPHQDRNLHVGGPGVTNSSAGIPPTEHMSEPKRRRTASEQGCNDKADFGHSNLEVGQSSQL